MLGPAPFSVFIQFHVSYFKTDILVGVEMGLVGWWVFPLHVPSIIAQGKKTEFMQKEYPCTYLIDIQLYSQLWAYQLTFGLGYQLVLNQWSSCINIRPNRPSWRVWKIYHRSNWETMTDDCNLKMKLWKCRAIVNLLSNVFMCLSILNTCPPKSHKQGPTRFVLQWFLT